VAFAVLASVAAIGIPKGWYGHAKNADAASQAATTAAATEPSAPSVAEVPVTETSPAESAPAEEHTDEAALAAKRQREREKAKAREEKAALTPSAPGSVVSSPAVGSEGAKPGAKKIAVTVTYDESGRVTQASGGDASAIRIARQKRFPAGKAGSATITIPIN